jgi:hypothetical protein
MVLFRSRQPLSGSRKPPTCIAAADTSRSTHLSTTQSEASVKSSATAPSRVNTQTRKAMRREEITCTAEGVKGK